MILRIYSFHEVRLTEAGFTNNPVRFGSATRTQNFEREVFFYYFSNFPLFLFVKLPDFRSRSLGPAISHCWSLFFPQIKSLSIDFLICAIRAKTIRTLLENFFS